MNRRETVLGNNAFRNENRVLEVVTIPRHECYQHVLPQRQLTLVGGGSICYYVATRNYVSHFHQRALVNVGVLVGTGIFNQVINVHTHFADACFGIMHSYHDTARIHIVHHTTTHRLDCGSGIHCHDTLNASTDERFLRAQARYCLSLHVGAHQCAISVIMFQKWNQ